MSVSVVTGEYEYDFSHLNPLYYFACGQDQNQNSLLVKRENDNTSTGLGGGGLVPRSHKDTQSSDSSAEVMRESRRSFQSMIVW